MKKTLLTLLAYTSITQASAEPLTLGNIDKISEMTQSVSVEVREGKHWENYTWDMKQNHIPIFYEKLKTLQDRPYKDTGLDIPNPDEKYEGLKIRIKLSNNEWVDPIFIYDGTVKSNWNLLSEDPDRHMEYWLFSLDTSLTNRKIVARALPIFTYKHCIDTGNPVVYTNPKQCLMANKEIFLDVPEQPTQESLTVSSFDECLTKGEALIDTFPRRCIVAGGHVFTEPPRVFTPPKPVRSKRYSTEKLFSPSK